MINAGIEVLPYDGGQSFNTTNQEWVGIKTRVNYPSDQNITNNPITVGDYLIEPNGNVWTITARTLTNSASRLYTLTVKLSNTTPSPDISPDMGQVSRGAVVTANKGFITPYWNSTLVAGDVDRIAAIFTANSNLRDNTSDANKPISTAAQTALNNKLEVTANAVSATKLATARTVALTGTVTGSTSFDGSANATIATTVAAASTTVAGTMSAADKVKLDAIAAGATNYVHPTSDGSLHVPATSTTNSGKVLTAGATAGSLSWTTPAAGVTLGSTAGVAPGTAAAGTATTAAHSDHVHPVQTTITGNAASATTAATCTGNAATATTAASCTGNAATATSANTAAACTGNAATATKLATARTVALTGTVTGSTTFDGSANATIATTVAAASTTVAGTMSAADKVKLDAIAAGATNYVHPSGDGSLHVPATGTTNSGKMLTAGATAGSLSWTTPAAGVTLGSTVGVAPGTAAAGTAGTAAHSDHVHPVQTTITGNAATATTATTATTAVTANNALACSGNSATATKLATARTINGVAFDGTAAITVADSTKLPLTGGTVTGQLTLNSSLFLNGAPSGTEGGEIFLQPATGNVKGAVILDNFDGHFRAFNVTSGYTYMLDVSNTGIAFNSNTVWVGGVDLGVLV
jgi:hypothetical protein